MKLEHKRACLDADFNSKALQTLFHGGIDEDGYDFDSRDDAYITGFEDGYNHLVELINKEKDEKILKYLFKELSHRDIMEIQE